MSFIAQADRQYARELGREHPERAWILSDRDAWYQNPFYNGPPVPHPEDDCGDEEYSAAPVGDPVSSDLHDDDIPF